MLRAYPTLTTLALLLCCALTLPAQAQTQGEEAGTPTLRSRIQARLQERRTENQAYPAAQAAWHKPGTHRFTLEHGGQERHYLVHVPPAYRPGHPTPVVFAFHGGGGSMDIMASAHYGLVDKADREGFLAVFPNGYSRWPGGKLATWNAGHCCGAARDKGSDDVGFVRAVLQQVDQRWSVDSKRVFATGMSNGGMMSYRLACEMADRFTAIAAVAGTDNTQQCRPNRPVPVLHIHALDDTHVLYQGGAGSDAFRDASAVTDFTSVGETVRRWTAHNQCASAPTRTLTVAGAYCDTYSPCAAAAPVRLCVTETGGHSWPGGSKVRSVGTVPSQALVANDAIWAFFRQVGSATAP